MTDESKASWCAKSAGRVKVAYDGRALTPAIETLSDALELAGSERSRLRRSSLSAHAHLSCTYLSILSSNTEQSAEPTALRPMQLRADHLQAGLTGECRRLVHNSFLATRRV